MTTRLAVTTKNEILQALLTNSANPYTLLYYVNMYTGAIPANPETAASGTQLVGNQTVMSGFQFASNGVGALSNSVSQTPLATGTAGWARWLKTSGNVALDVDLGLAASGAGMILNTLALTSGVPVSILNASLQMPASLGTVLLNTALRNKMVDILLQAPANIGLGYNGFVDIYSGAAPATADAPATGTLLVTHSLGTAAWTTPASGSAALAATITTAALATGTAAYARIRKGAYVLQGTVGTAGADFTVDSTALVLGNNTSLTNATVSL